MMGTSDVTNRGKLERFQRRERNGPAHCSAKPYIGPSCPCYGGAMTWLRLLLVLVATLSLTACEAIGDIFQAGMAVGVIMVVAVIALIGFLIAKVRS